MAITERTLRLQRELAAFLARIADTQTRDLVRAWVEAWDEVAPDLTEALLEQLTSSEQVTRSQLLKSTRLRNALVVIKDTLDQLATTAGVRMTGDLRDVIDTAGAAQASVIDSQLPANSSHLVDLDTWSRVDERQVEAMVRRTTQRITSSTRPLSADAYQVVRRELIRSVAAGSNPRVTAARMVRRAEKGFNGGLTRALVIARTESADAFRAAAALGQADHADVLRGWVWTASLSSRTCPACLSMNGREFPLAEPGPQGHQQCRCARVPVTKSWKDLGFDIPEPAPILPDARAYFDGLPKADQVAILGPSRYDAWTAGDYPIDQWATKRSNAGWRDSYVVSPAPQSGGRVSRSAA